MSLMVLILTPNLCASAVAVSVLSSRIRRISITSAAVSFVLVPTLPARCGARPFITMSALFSAAVPGHICAGLQQGGLSQWWQASMSNGKGLPLANSHARRWASTGGPRPPLLICPYPW